MSGRGKVTLVGAGPGDPELITTRGLRRLREADVVLYDALVHPDQLAACRPDAERIFVGKRAGRSSERQTAIHDRMVAAARAGKNVVRLKGGDPFLFGRGSEEAEALAAADVPFEVVPGVPSPIAATAYTGISLTHRDLASSVAYLTATESVDKDRTSHDWAKLATATQTLVIFMGMRKLDTLMSLLVEHGRSPDTPAAVVQWTSLPRQRVVVGTVGTIAACASEAGLGLPALTIVGDVVRLRERLRWYDRRPLFGKRVLITRALHQSATLATKLRDLGAEPVAIPTIRTTDPSNPAPLRDAVAQLTDFDWVVLTSQNGVDRLFAEIARQGGDARRLGRARVAAIGPKTAAALEARGVRPDVVPDEYRGEAVADAILRVATTPPGARVLLARAEVAREALPDQLRAAGLDVAVAPAYRTEGPTEEERAALRERFERGEIDVVTLTSSSTVEHLVAALGDRAAELLSRATIASIGPITTATAERLGLTVAVTASEYTTEGLVTALAQYYEEGSRP